MGLFISPVRLKESSQHSLLLLELMIPLLMVFRINVALAIVWRSNFYNFTNPEMKPAGVAFLKSATNQQ
jgi:hypothetical protein